jgi:hypothetical protein
MATCLRVLALSVLALVMAQPASAQVFVSGGPFANVLRFGNYFSESPSKSEEDLSGTSLGLLVAVGGVFASHAVVQVEFAIPKQIHTDIPPYQSLYPGTTPDIVSQRSVDSRNRHVSILAGYQTAQKHRMRAAVLGGIMFIEETTRVLTSYETPVPSPFLLPEDRTNKYQRMAPVVAFDLTCSVTPHLAVVPQIRMHKANTITGYGVIGIWPGVSARWTF